MRLRPRSVPALLTLVGVCACLLLAACDSPDADTDEDVGVVASAAETLAALDAISTGTTPDHFDQGQTARLEGDFDVNTFFTALPHLSVEDGWVLDYVYEATGMGGRPVLYAHPAGQPAYDSYEAWYEAVGEGELVNGISTSHTEDYLDHIQTDDTAEGYFELALFGRVSDQFYLDWHAAYNDSRVVCDKTTLERALEGAKSFLGSKLPAGVRKRALKADVRPTSLLRDDGTAVVRLVIFTKWGGLVEHRYTFNRQLPHTLVDSDSTTLVEYDCGVRF